MRETLTQQTVEQNAYKTVREKHNKQSTKHIQNTTPDTSVTYCQTEHRQNSARGTNVTESTEHIQNSARDSNVTNSHTEQIKTVHKTRT